MNLFDYEHIFAVGTIPSKRLDVSSRYDNTCV